MEADGADQGIFLLSCTGIVWCSPFQVWCILEAGKTLTYFRCSAVQCRDNIVNFSPGFRGSKTRILQLSQLILFFGGFCVLGNSFFPFNIVGNSQWLCFPKRSTAAQFTGKSPLGLPFYIDFMFLGFFQEPKLEILQLCAAPLVLSLSGNCNCTSSKTTP